MKSHIVPEFLYKELYDSQGRMLGINGIGNKGYKFVQKGIREKLLCAGCEQFLNDTYEKPFKEYWIDKNPLPNTIISEDKVSFKVPSYSKFRLFHLVNLFRAGISSLPEFAKIKLGTHEEKLREMILHENPGDPNLYLLIGYVVLHDQTSVPVRNVVFPPEPRRFDGTKCFSMIYGGVEWWITFVNHRTSKIREVALSVQGDMSLMGVPMRSIPSMHTAKHALARRII
jgi:hypothetical protein